VKSKVKCYLAGAVRGIQGDKVSPTTMQRNVQKRVDDVQFLRSRISDIEIYCPHEHEDLFTEAYLEELVTSKMILHQCFAIVRLCDLLIATSNPRDSEGVAGEVEEAERQNIPILNLWRSSHTRWPKRIVDFWGKPLTLLKPPVGESEGESEGENESV